MPNDDYSYEANRTLFMSLIRPIRDADFDQGRDFLKRFLSRMEFNADQAKTRIKSLEQTDNFATLQDALVKFMKSHVGFTSELDNITNRLSTATLKKLCSGAVALWKRRGTPVSMINMIRLLTGRSATYYNWFYYRAILGNTLGGHAIDGATLALWRLNEAFASAAAIDETGVYNLTGSNNPLPTTGQVGGARVTATTTTQNGFTSATVSDGVFAAALVSGNWTIEMWANIDAAISGNVFTWNNHNGTMFRALGGQACILGMGSGGTWRAFLGGAGRSFSSIAGTTGNSWAALSRGTWHHIVFRGTSAGGGNGIADVFVDGVKVATTSSVYTLPGSVANGNFIVGGEQVTFDNFVGAMDDVRVSTVSRSDAEISDSYARGFYTPTQDSKSFSIGEDQAGYDAWLLGGSASVQDEFYSQIRMMDPGVPSFGSSGTDAQLLLDIANLCRPISERIEIALLDFWDTFADGSLSRWQGIDASVSDGIATIPPGAGGTPNLRQIRVDGSGAPIWDDYTEYIVGMKMKFSGTGPVTYTLLQDNNGSIKVTIQATQDGRGGAVSITHVTDFANGEDGGSFGSFGAIIKFGVWYTFRVWVRGGDGSGNFGVRCTLDGNLLCEVYANLNSFIVDPSDAPRHGTWSFLNSSVGDVQFTNVETWRTPRMRFATVGPSGYSYTDNYLTG